MKSKFLLTLGLISTTMSLSAQTNQQVLDLINKEVQQNSEAYQQLKKATETIGHRATGTENGRIAEEYAANLLRSYGYDVSFQEFTFSGWNRRSLDLKINNQPIKAVALAHSPENVSLSGELIDLGNGLEEDYKKIGDKVKGKIVFAALGLLDGTPKEIENLHRSEKTALAEKYGAKGIILFNRPAGGILLTGTASVTGEIIKIPAINISLEDGLKIKENLSKGKEIAKIEMKNDVGQMKGRNIIAKKIGSKFPNEKIVLGGHLDSWDLATGAIDNGVGSFSVMDIARTYKKLNLQNDRTIEFVLFMGEEVGLIGSKYYVNQALKDGSINQIKAMSNMDMTTNPKSYYSTMESNLPILTDYANDVQKVIPDFKLKTFASVDLHSDHQPFMLQGVPIIGLSDSQFTKGALNCYHANCDTFDYVEEIGLKNNVILETYLLYRLSNLKEIPSKRWNEQEIKEALIKGNLETPLRISGDWRW
ncbi:M28 family peptidase [Empedobacter sp. GD03797]|uniref:M28 family peptidase n=1 Tax=Empedobacter sp. GD03797 TaxID=2975382 RepID=UPI00244B9EDA|nr:M28 family peptidase [Empedobacter sp. GD03797]MDH1882898.1 M28 family peptidase [Empedobacter sp. GD03797]